MLTYIKSLQTKLLILHRPTHYTRKKITKSKKKKSKINKLDRLYGVKQYHIIS